MSAASIIGELSELERDLTLRRLLWESQEEWTRLYDDWTDSSFDSVNVEAVQRNVTKFTQTVFMLEKGPTVEHFRLARWISSKFTFSLSLGLPINDVLPHLKAKVLEFKQNMPVVMCLRNPALRPRHWDRIEQIIQRTVVRDKTFTLGDLLEMNVCLN